MEESGSTLAVVVFVLVSIRMEQVLGAAVRDAVAGLATTVALFESREIEGSALTALRKASAGWGIQIGRVEVVSVERS